MTAGRIIARIALCGAAIATAAIGSTLADSVVLNPSEDTTLYEVVGGANEAGNGAGEYIFTGNTKDDNLSRRTVLKFNIAGNIPAGATIDSVQLKMRASRVRNSTNRATTLHRLLADWGEDGANSAQNEGQGTDCGAASPSVCDGGATWQHTFFDSSFWATPGGDYTPASSASTNVGGTGEYFWGSTSGMVADVQFWLDNPSSNYGWIVIGVETQAETAKRFDSSENTGGGGSRKPELTINFTPTTISGACCDESTCTIETETDCLTVVGGAYEGDGTSCSPNPCIDPVGACCATDGTCTDVAQSTCTGTFQGEGTTCSAVECEIILTPFIDPLPLPEIANPVSGASGDVATYDLTMKEFTQVMHSELPATTVWGYDDGIGAPPATPGPVIIAREDKPVTVNWINDIRVGGGGLPRDGTAAPHYLAVDVTQDASGNICIHGAENKAKAVVHLHGGHVPADVDGYPEDTFVPGLGTSSEVQYVYPNGQQAGYLWFHDHALGITRLNVYMGLAGGYLLRDDVEDALNIPSGSFEVPLIVQDRKFNPDGSLNYPAMWQDHFFGDKAMVNGKVWPFLDVTQGKYRFKLLNGSGSRVYTFSLNPPSGLLTFTVIGTEGGLLEAPVNGVGNLTIGPGERYDVVVDFSGYNVGDEILLENSAGAPFPNGPVSLTQIMKFKVVSGAAHTDPLPGTLRPIERLQEGDSILTRDFRLKKSGTDGCGRTDWLINDLKWDDITEYPELGTTEIWRFINDSGVAHPMHMHLVFFQVLDRQDFTVDGSGNIVPTPGTQQPPPAEENGWKDTAMVNPNEILRVIVRFEDYKGKYAYHCHILEHEDHEMMRQFQTVRCGDVAIDPTEECDDGGKVSFDGCTSSCDIEERLVLSGTANGDGIVSLTIEGTPITEVPSNGDSAAQVAAALAAAINANPTLSAAGVTATSVGGTLYVVGDITAISITDTGLADDIDVLLVGPRISWAAKAGATGYDVVQGSLLSLLTTGGSYANPSTTTGCLADNETQTYLVNGDIPAAGDGTWYLIRSQGTGSDTYESGASSQVAPRNAAIAASGNDCL